MAKDETRRLVGKDLQSDKDCLDALKKVEGYSPANQKFVLPNVIASYDAMILAQEKETQQEAAFKKARDQATDAEWAFHNHVLGSKDQVRAQFGSDSNEIQALGLKKVSEFKKRKPKAKQPK